MVRHELGVVLAAGIACATATLPAGADIYKWVDERGAVTYSDHPPKDRGRIKEVFAATEQPAPVAATAAAPAYAAQQLHVLAERVDRLTRELEAERSARESPRVALFPQELNESRMLDYGWYGGPYYYAPAVGLIGTPFGHRMRHFDHGTRGFVPAHRSPVLRGGRAVPAHSGKIGLRMR